MGPKMLLVMDNGHGTLAWLLPWLSSKIYNARLHTFSCFERIHSLPGVEFDKAKLRHTLIYTFAGSVWKQECP